MAENNLITITAAEKSVRANVIHVRVNEALFKRVYAVGSNTGEGMSEVVRLCVEAALPQVEKVLTEVRRLKKVKL